MNDVKFQIPRIKIHDIHLTNDDHCGLSVTIWLYDNEDNYVGSVILDSEKTNVNNICISKNISDLIADLFLAVDTDVKKNDLISFLSK